MIWSDLTLFLFFSPLFKLLCHFDLMHDSSRLYGSSGAESEASANHSTSAKQDSRLALCPHSSLEQVQHPPPASVYGWSSTTIKYFVATSTPVLKHRRDDWCCGCQPGCLEISPKSESLWLKCLLLSVTMQMQIEILKPGALSSASSIKTIATTARLQLSTQDLSCLLVFSHP